MSALFRAWDRFWFPDSASLVRLGVFRILVAAMVIYDVYIVDATVMMDAALVDAGSGMRPWRPILLLQVFGLGPIGLDAAQLLCTGVLVSALLSLFGVFSRVSCLVMAVLWIYLASLHYSFGKPHHDRVSMAIAICALPLGPVGVRMSFDALVTRYWRTRRGGAPTAVPVTHRHALAPIRLTQLVLVLGYAAAGWSKILISGPGWMNGYTLMGIMLGHDNAWSHLASSNVLLAQVMSVGAIVLQASMPVILFWPRARWFYVPGAVLFHMGTWLTMDTGPYMTLWAFLPIAFVPWERALPQLRFELLSGAWWKRLRAALLCFALPIFVLDILSIAFPAWIWLLLVPLGWVAIQTFWHRARIDVVYDGQCGICRRAVSVLLALDWLGRMRLLDFRDWKRTSGKHPGLDYEACDRDIHAVDGRGRVTKGVLAYRQFAWRMPVLLPVALLLHVAPFRAIAERVYRHVADHRRAVSCGVDPSGPGAE